MNICLYRLEGKDSWKTTDDSSLFDSRLIGARLMNLAEARASGDIDQIVFVLRAGLIRNIGGIGNPKLYAHCLTGTKTIIEEARAKGRGYVLVLVCALECLYHRLCYYSDSMSA